MNRGKKHMLGRGARRLRDHVPPAIVGIVTNFAPVDGEPHHGLFAADEHDTLGEEGIHISFAGSIPPAMPGCPRGAVTSAVKVARVNSAWALRATTQKTIRIEKIRLMVW